MHGSWRVLRGSTHAWEGMHGPLGEGMQRVISITFREAQLAHARELVRHTALRTQSLHSAAAHAPPFLVTSTSSFQCPRAMSLCAVHLLSRSGGPSGM